MPGRPRNSYVAPGLPGGTLGAPIVTATPLRTQALVVADLDDDHQRDAIIAGDGSPGALVVHWGQGDGTFVQPPLTLVAGNGTTGVATGWINGDAPGPGLVRSGGQHALRLVRRGVPRVRRARLVTAAGGSPSALALGDFNEDGLLDVVAALTATPLPAVPRALAYYAGLGNGGFDPPIYTMVGYLPRDIRVADLDGDGHLDVALANTEAATVSVLRGDGAGNFTDRINYGTEGGAAALALADLDLDGKPDITVAAQSPNGITLLLQRPAISAVPERPASPGIALLPAWPNPTRAGATIPFRLAAPTHARLNIYDVTGRLVARLADRAFDPGDHTLEWDGAHATGGRARPASTSTNWPRRGGAWHGGDVDADALRPGSPRAPQAPRHPNRNRLRLRVPPRGDESRQGPYSKLRTSRAFRFSSRTRRQPPGVGVMDCV